MNVAPNMPVVIQAGATLTVNGTANFATGDSVAINGGSGGCCSSPPAAIAVAPGARRTLNAVGTSFTTTGVGNLVVNAGGHLNVTGSSVNLTTLTLKSFSSAALSTDVLYGLVTINSNTTISIAGNDFSNLGTRAVVASGDPAATIVLERNWWGTTVPSQIQAKILDHNTDANLPTIDYTHYVSGTSGTSAPGLSRHSDLQPDRSVGQPYRGRHHHGGVPINEGTETFTICNGTQLIGQTTAPANVSNGDVSATYTLPGRHLAPASTSSRPTTAARTTTCPPPTAATS